MATTVTKIVDPDNGTGTDYTSLSAWEAGMQKDLTAADEISVAECRCTSGTADSTAVAIDGWTTDATRYIKIWTNPSGGYRHLGAAYDATKYRLAISLAHQASAILVQEDYVKIIGLQFYPTIGNWAEGYGVRLNNAAAGTLHVDKCIFSLNNAASGANAGQECVLINWMGTNRTIYITNCLFHDTEKNNFTTWGTVCTRGEAAATYVYNNTFINGDVAIACEVENAITAKNNLVYGHATAMTGTFAAGTDYNATDDAAIGYTVTGSGNTHDRVSQTFTFAAAGDYHLASNDAGAKDYGVSDPGSGLFSDDIDGVTRTGTWDIGADEYVAAATGQPTIKRWGGVPGMAINRGVW
jgi:hypothetical protein